VAGKKATAYSKKGGGKVACGSQKNRLENRSTSRRGEKEEGRIEIFINRQRGKKRKKKGGCPVK